MAEPKKVPIPLPVRAPSRSPLVTFLMVMVSTFTLVLVGMLFATGAAQKSAIPRVRAALARFQKPESAPAPADSAAAGDSAAVATTPWSVGADSLGLLRDEIDLAMRELAESQALTTAASESVAVEVAAASNASAADSSAIRDFTRFVKVIEAMKPAEAARLLNGVDDGFAVAVVRRLKERQAAKVMTLLDPAKAHAVTLALGRGAEATS